ncbi:AsmA family protein [Pseudothauera rhizosphaerae]|uniref:AsmA family protein n=1 Tax=Pseudothauera rhizosphaerae TaxID=2565932 RepID=A0A4S4A9R5_9RHOO|nr:AsmA family protein [Pseudothauera rhizosphaerae]THF55617.1 AsmA family protein [Pseudothauera rhizosphaerae]
MKALKIGLLALLAIVVLVVGVAVFLVATFDANRHKETLVELVREKSGRELKIGGDVGLALFPRLAVTAAGLNLTDPDGKTPFAAIDEVELAVQVLPLLKGAVEVDRVRVIRPELNYRRLADGRSNIDDLTGATAAGGADKGGDGGKSAGAGGDLALDIRGVELVDARVKVDDAQGGLKGEVSGLNLTLGRFAPATPAPLAFSTAFAFTQPALRGKLDLTTSLFVDAGQAALRDLTLDLALQPAATAPIQLALKGEVAHGLADGSTHAQVTGKLDDSKLEGRVDAVAGQPLKFEFKLDRLDVDRYTAGQPASQPVAAAPAAKPAAGAGDAQPVDLSFAAMPPLEGRLEVGELRAAGLSLSALSASLKGDGRTLAVAPLTASGYGGTLQGEVRIDSQARRVQTRQTYADIQVGPLLRDLSGKDTLEGRGRLQFDLDTRGRTVGELKRALAGTAALNLRDGAVKGYNIGQILRDGQALLGGKRDEAHQFRSTEQTDFSALDATFRIAGGVARNDDLAMQSPLLRLGGAGLVDIGANRIDYTLRATVVPTAEGQGGAGLDKLAGLTVPVRITGPLEGPSPQVQWSAVAGQAARSAIAERLEKKLGGSGESGKDGTAAKPEDALKEELGRRLKGLLR